MEDIVQEVKEVKTTPRKAGWDVAGWVEAKVFGKRNEELAESSCPGRGGDDMLTEPLFTILEWFSKLEFGFSRCSGILQTWILLWEH